MFSLYAKLTKVDEAKRMVFGRAVDETPDHVDEIFDYTTSKAHFENWSREAAEATDGKSLGNLRAMHGKVAAGKLTDISFDDVNKTIDVATHVVDDNEWTKVLEGVYTGFSIGGSYIKKWNDSSIKKSDGKPAQRYTAKPSELSLVDRPCVPSARFFSIQKADGTTVEAEFKPVLDEKDINTEARNLCKADGFDPDSTDATDVKAHRPLWKAYESAAVANLTKAATHQEEVADPAAEEIAKAAQIKKDADDAEAKKTADALEADKVTKATPAATIPAVAAATEYEVEGSEADVSKLANLMEVEKLSVADVIKLMENAIVIQKADVERTELLAKEESGELKKGMYLVATVANIVAQLESIRSSVVYEEKSEADSASTLPTKAGNLLSAGIDLLREMVQEESAELLAASADPSPYADVFARAHFGELQKIGARNSTSDTNRIQKVHDLAVDLGCSCGTKEAAEAPADLSKVLGSPDLQKMLDGAISKALAPLQKANVELLEKVAKLEAQPAAPKGVLRVVSKSADVATAIDPLDKAAPVISNGKENEAATLIKSVHQSGGTRVGFSSP